MIPLDLTLALSDLSLRRRAFHSEADFQFSLAWAIQQRYSDARVMLEVPSRVLGCADQLEEVDIVVERFGTRSCVELKYCARGAPLECDGQEFRWGKNPPMDGKRHGFLSDVARLERFAREHGVECAAVLLTNVQALWADQPTGPRVNDWAFRLTEGRVLEPGCVLNWTPETSAETRNQYPSVRISSPYTLQWREYGAGLPPIDRNKRHDSLRFGVLTVQVKPG